MDTGTNQHKSVWLVEDNTSYRESIDLIVNQSKSFICNAQFSSWEKAIKMLESLLKKVPEAKAQPLLIRRKQYRDELKTERRIAALEEKYGA